MLELQPTGPAQFHSSGVFLMVMCSTLIEGYSIVTPSGSSLSPGHQVGNLAHANLCQPVPKVATIQHQDVQI